MPILCINTQYFKNGLVNTLLFALLYVAGCNSTTLSTVGQIREFDKAGPIIPKVNTDCLLEAKIHKGSYRVVPGDILELQMPALSQIISSEQLSNWVQKPNLYQFRVSNTGKITLPIIGQMHVLGNTLTEIESSITNSYFPKYFKNRPAIICKVKEHKKQNVTILGAVEKPGIYALNHNEMSLVSVLMKAGGIVADGARAITIEHHDNKTEKIKDVNQIETVDVNNINLDSIVLPVKELNIPFADVALYDGDVVKVEKLNPQVFTVFGLVLRPGAFPYPQDAQYNLMQALAFAGGIDLIADPRCVTIYRQKANGEIISATFGLDKKSFSNVCCVKIKPGDVISVDVTSRARLNILMSQIFRINFGVYANSKIFNDNDD